MTAEEQYLRSLGKPYITIPDCARAIGITYEGLFYRCRDLDQAEKPEAHGAFRAGGTLTFVLETGIDWVNHHVAYWAERQANKRARAA